MNLDDLETLNGQNAFLHKKLIYRANQKMWMKVDLYYQRQNVGQWFYFLEI